MSVRWCSVCDLVPVMGKADKCAECARLCVVCLAAPKRRRQRCSTCWTYREKYGVDRPYPVRRRHLLRQEEKRLSRWAG